MGVGAWGVGIGDWVLEVGPGTSPVGYGFVQAKRDHSTPARFQQPLLGQEAASLLMHAF